MNDHDIVTRLRRDCMSLIADEAADEIERLRAERDGYLQGNRQTLRALDEANEIARKYKRERDEARREVCLTWESVMGREAQTVAADKGWNCYPEATDARPADATPDD